MRKNKIMIFTLLISILMTMIPSAVSFAAEGESAITVIGSTIKNDKEYFELSLKINSGAVGFSAAGIVLQYKSDVINPVSWDSEGTLVTMTDTSNWQNIASIPAISPKELSGKTALAYQGSDNTGYLYLSSESALPLAELTESMQRTITIRFRYTGEDDTAKAASKQSVIDGFESGSIVSLAPDEVAANSPAGQSVVYSTGIQDKDYYYTLDAENTAGLKIGELLSEAPQLVLEQDAESANTGGGGDVSKFAALVFFDWDESTLLGSMVVDSAMSVEEIKETINTFTQTLMPPEIDMTGWNDETAKATTVYNPDYPLTSHNGYTFGKWIEYTSEDFTIYGNSVSATDSTSMEIIDSPADPDYTKLSSGLVLKAAYIANTIMDSLENATVREYTVSIDAAPELECYTRYGTSASYSLKFNVLRVNSENYPVQRTRTTALRVTYNIGSTAVYSIVNIENIDQQIVEVAAPANADSVSVSVIDTGGVSNWVTGSAARSSLYSVNSAPSNDDLGYVIYGNVNYINQQIAKEGATTFSAVYFSAASINVSKGNVYGTTATAAGKLRTQATTNIRNGQQHKYEETGILYLSHDEMQNAVSRGNYNDYGV